MKPRKVFVYRNIRNNLYSVRDCQTGRVVKRLKSLRLRDCQFRVGEAGRQRVLSTGVKNVHAGIVGYLTTKHIDGSSDWSFASYNPRTACHFFDVLSKDPLVSANLVELRPDGIVIYA